MARGGRERVSRVTSKSLSPSLLLLETPRGLRKVEPASFSGRVVYGAGGRAAASTWGSRQLGWWAVQQDVSDYNPRHALRGAPTPGREDRTCNPSFTSFIPVMGWQTAPSSLVCDSLCVSVELMAIVIVRGQRKFPYPHPFCLKHRPTQSCVLILPGINLDVSLAINSRTRVKSGLISISPFHCV